MELLAELPKGWLAQQLIPSQFYPQGNVMNNAGKGEEGERGGRGEELSSKEELKVKVTTQ